MPLSIARLDHLVLTVKSISRSVSFYTKVLNFSVHKFGDGRTALAFGSQKINLHEYGKEFEPKAEKPTPGSADLCFISETPLKKVIEHLKETGTGVLEGPVERTGAVSKLLSVYFRDPDNNLIEVSNEIDRGRTVNRIEVEYSDAIKSE